MLTPSGAEALGTWMMEAAHNQTAFLGARFPSRPGQERFSMDVFVFWSELWLHRYTSAWENATCEASSHVSIICRVVHLSRTRAARARASLALPESGDFSGDVKSRLHRRWCLHGFAPGERPPAAQPRIARGGETLVDQPFLIPEFLLNEVRERFDLTFRMLPGGGGYLKSGFKMAATKPRPGPRGVPHSIWHSHNAKAVEAWARSEALRRSGARQGPAPAA